MKRSFLIQAKENALQVTFAAVENVDLDLRKVRLLA